MAGPSFTILMRFPLTSMQISELDAWLRTFTVHLQTRVNVAGECDEWYFCVADASVLGLLDSSQSCMIGLALVEPPQTWDGDKEEQMMILLEFWPRYGITVYAMCKDFSTGRVMSYLILRIMERYGGYLDLGRRERSAGRSRLSMEERQPEQPLLGKRYSIRYWAPDPQYGFYFSCWWEEEVIDDKWLHWWLQDGKRILPGFRIE